MSKKDEILLEAWNLSKDDLRIKKFFFFPGLLSIIFLTVLLVYQSIYTYVIIFNKKDKALELILEFFHSTYISEVIIVWVIFIIIYLIIIPITEWWLIKYLHKKDIDWEASISESMWVWLYRFLPLFEYNNMFSEFKFISILNWYLFMIRFFDGKHIKQLSYIFIVIFLISIIINTLFVYSKYIIILENKSVFESITKSMRLAILNNIITLKLYIFMFLLNIRVIINFIVFLTFPIIISLAIWFITTKIFLALAIAILSILFLIFIMFLWYLSWALEVFTTAIWYYAYKRANSISENNE